MIIHTPTNPQEEKKDFWKSVGLEIEYVGHANEDAADPVTPFIVVKNNVRVYLMAKNAWLETMSEKQVALRLKCVVDYGTRTKRNMAKDLLDSLSEFELWFEKALPDSVLVPFVENAISANRYFKRIFDDQGTATHLKICGLDETIPCETWIDRKDETFRKILGKMLLDQNNYRKEFP